MSTTVKVSIRIIRFAINSPYVVDNSFCGQMEDGRRYSGQVQTVAASRKFIIVFAGLSAVISGLSKSLSPQHFGPGRHSFQYQICSVGKRIQSFSRGALPEGE